MLGCRALLLSLASSYATFRPLPTQGCAGGYTLSTTTRTGVTSACAAALPQAVAAKSVCPRRQLLTFVAFTAGRGSRATTVHTRAATGNRDWQPVGLVAAGTSDAADESPEGLVRAAQLQRRLIAEHACRLYPELRSVKREMGLIEGIEVAVKVKEGADDVATFRPLPIAQGTARCPITAHGDRH